MPKYILKIDIIFCYTGPLVQPVALNQEGLSVGSYAPIIKLEKTKTILLTKDSETNVIDLCLVAVEETSVIQILRANFSLGIYKLDSYSKINVGSKSNSDCDVRVSSWDIRQLFQGTCLLVHRKEMTGTFSLLCSWPTVDLRCLQNQGKCR